MINSASSAGAVYAFTLFPEFESVPGTPGPLAMQGIAGTPALATFSVGNTASSATKLDIAVQSITPGYSVVAGLPVISLSGSGSAVHITVQCDNPGTSPVNGTLVLMTNEFGTPTYGYNLTCQEEAPATETPTPPPSETPAPVTGRVAPFDGQVIATGGEYISRFQWTPIDGAEWYHVFVWTGEADGIIHDQWYEAAAVCADGLCTSQEIWLMSAGEFSWWMTHWSEAIGDGFIDLYAESRFSVTMPAPGAIAGLSTQSETWLAVQKRSHCHGQEKRTHSGIRSGLAQPTTNQPASMSGCMHQMSAQVRPAPSASRCQQLVTTSSGCKLGTQQA